MPLMTHVDLSGHAIECDTISPDDRPGFHHAYDLAAALAGIFALGDPMAIEATDSSFLLTGVKVEIDLDIVHSIVEIVFDENEITIREPDENGGAILDRILRSPDGFIYDDSGYGWKRHNHGWSAENGDFLCTEENTSTDFCPLTIWHP